MQTVNPGLSELADAAMSYLPQKRNSIGELKDTSSTGLRTGRQLPPLPSIFSRRSPSPVLVSNTRQKLDHFSDNHSPAHHHSHAAQHHQSYPYAHGQHHPPAPPLKHLTSTGSTSSTTATSMSNHDSASSVQEALRANAFRRDMENAADISSKLYHFAARAAPGRGTESLATVTTGPYPVRFPEVSEFDVAIGDARQLLRLLESWRDYEPPNRVQARTPAPMARPYDLDDPRRLKSITPAHYGSYSHEPIVRTSANSTPSVTVPPFPGPARSPAASYSTHAPPPPTHLPPLPRASSISGYPSHATPPSIAPHQSQVPSVGSNDHKISRQAAPGRCHSCNISETPEWRRGPDGARTLCNACGLHYAKLTKKKQQQQQQQQQQQHHQQQAAQSGANTPRG
ncbi:glutamate--cysteine ligase [Savitreella phatthalungensis]